MKARITEEHVRSMPLPPKGGSRTDFDTEYRGFAVRIISSGTRTFLFCYVDPDGKEKRYPFAKWKAQKRSPGDGVTVEKAREQFLELRADYKRHKKLKAEQADPDAIDPASKQRREQAARLEAKRLAEEARKAADRELTVAQLCEQYIEGYAKKNKRSWAEDQRRINRKIIPRWGDRKAKTIQRADVQDLLEDLFDEGKNAEAQHCRALVSGIYSYAMSKRKIDVDHNPCHGLGKVERANRVKPRTRALKQVREIRFLLAVTDTTRRRPRLRADMAEALRFMLLTGCRPGEATGLRWEEIDFDRAEWNKPDDVEGRSKSDRADVTPLVPELLDMLRARQGNGSAYVWPSGRSRRVVNGLGEGSLTANKLSTGLRNLMPLARRLKIEEFTPHDVRRTVLTWLGMLQVRSHVIERVANHARRGVTDTHYNMHEYVPEKREALELLAAKWNEIAAGASSNVVPFRKVG